VNTFYRLATASYAAAAAHSGAKMAEYVYALHDFQPENEDEVPFQTGERIEVVEKDDEFGDGWWQVSPDGPPPHVCRAGRTRPPGACEGPPIVP
jgi:hypothetical protein